VFHSAVKVKFESDAGTVHVAPPAYVFVPSLQPANVLPVFDIVFDAGSVIVSPTTLPVSCVVVAVEVPPSSAYVTVLEAAVHFANKLTFVEGVNEAFG
jgi:hypothetical protein